MPTVLLPNGNEVTFPEGASEEMVREYAIAVGLASPEDFDQGFSITQFLKENLDIPLGLGGAAGGAALGATLGSAVPVVGTAVGGIVGSVIGGALGTGTGSLLSDVVNEEDLDYAQAMLDAGLSVGIDILTLGLGSKLKGMVATAKAMGYAPEEAANIIAKQAQEGAAAGSPESLAATQQFLSERGASLLPTQTGKASEVTQQMEALAQFGVLSQAQLEKNTAKVAGAVQDSLTSLLNREGEDLFTTPQELGENMIAVLDSGKSSLSQVYQYGLDNIKDRLSGQVTVPAKPLRDALRRFAVSKKDDVTHNLDADTMRYILDEISLLRDKPRITAQALINFEKRLNQKISKVTTRGDGYNDQAGQELGSLADSLKSTVANTLQTVDPEVADIYRGIKQTYGEGIESLLPEINSSFVRGAKKGDYEKLGSFLTETGSANKLNKFMKSIDTAFDAMTAAGLTGLGKEVAEEGVGFVSSQQAKEAIKQGYVRNLFSDIDGNFALNPALAKEYQKPKKAAKLLAVLGEDAKHVKQLMNVMAETTTKQGSGFLGLSLAGKQVGAISGLLGGAALGSIAGFTGGVGTAAAVLLSPLLLSMKYTDPKFVNRLIAIDKKEWPSIKAKEVYVTNLLVDTIASLSMEDQARLRADVRERSVPQSGIQQQAVGM